IIKEKIKDKVPCCNEDILSFIFPIPFKGFSSPFPECIKRNFYTYLKGAYIQMDTQQLYFLNDIGKQKPESIRNRSAA
ncbi:hypothetical protein OFM88_32760, partial [Escherichia coli]|nr:hypothetical protein [Escherichia coli]